LHRRRRWPGLLAGCGSRVDPDQTRSHYPALRRWKESPMPDQEGDTQAPVPETSLHAYKEGRKDDIKGDADKLASDDPKDLQASALEDPNEPGPPEKH
jgi:hypothetical protein